MTLIVVLLSTSQALLPLEPVCFCPSCTCSLYEILAPTPNSLQLSLADTARLTCTIYWILEFSRANAAC